MGQIVTQSTFKVAVHFFDDDDRLVAEESVETYGCDYEDAVDVASVTARNMQQDFGAAYFEVY